MNLCLSFKGSNRSELIIGQQMKNLEKKIDPFKKEKIRIIGEYINDILPEDLKNFSLKEESLRGPVIPLKRKIKTLLSILERKHRFSFDQILNYIEELEPDQKKPKKREKPKKINQDLDKLYINHLFELINTTVEVLIKLDEKVILREGLDLFLQWNKVPNNINLSSIRGLVKEYNPEHIDPMKYYSEGFDMLENAFNLFFKNLKKLEIKILFVGFCLWGKIIEYLHKCNEIILIFEENLPIINLRIYESIELLVNNSEWISSKCEIREVYNDIYDQTEGYRIIIEPWNIV